MSGQGVEEGAGRILRDRLTASLIEDGAHADAAAASIRVWPPAEWCSALNPERTHICDQPRGHDGDHSGVEMPTVEIDEPTRALPPTEATP